MVKAEYLFDFKTTGLGDAFHVFCNASNVAVGSALCQFTGEKGKD